MTLIYIIFDSCFLINFMIITYYGLQAFKIQPKNSTDGTIAVNPLSDKTGIKMPKIEADLLLLSNKKSDNNDTARISNDPFVIDTAGEYDIKNISIKGIDTYDADNNKNVIYKINVEKISILHLGELKTKLETKQLEEINKVDILIVPISNVDGKITEIIGQIEPRLIIPMSYKMDALKLDLKELDGFIKETGLTPTYEDKLKIVKKDLPQDETELVVFNIK